MIIVNWNTRRLLRACLDSLRRYLDHAECEIIVIDNASRDGSPEMVTKDFPAARLITLPENIGFSRGNNQGINIALGQYILLLNSDTEVHDDALWKLCDYLDAHPDVGAVGPQLISPDGSIQQSCRAFPSHKTALFNRKSLLTRLFPSNRFSAQYLLTDEHRNTTREVDWIMGAALMTRRSVIDQVGPLDPEFFMYAEDVDWCKRMHKAGWKIVYHPAAKILHHYEKSARKVPFRMNYQRHRSMWLYYKKHHQRNPLKDVATLGGIALRMTTIAATDMLRSFRRQ